MPSNWTEVVSTFQSGGNISKRDTSIGTLVAGWHQECRDLSLQLSQFLGRNVDVYISKKGLADPNTRLANDVEELCESGELRARLTIPDTASDMRLAADLRSRTVRVSMELDAPRDKQRTSSRVNWLLRQLKGVDPTDTIIRLKWSSKAQDTDISLSVLQGEPKLDELVQSNVPLRAFEIIMNSTSGQRFKGRKTFIEEVETICPQFYERIGQHLKAWQPTPPKPKKYNTKSDETERQNRKPDPNNRPSGNEHTALLEVPSFLKRVGSISEGIKPASRDRKHRPVSRFQPHYIIKHRH